MPLEQQQPLGCSIHQILSQNNKNQNKGQSGDHLECFFCGACSMPEEKPTSIGSIDSFGNLALNSVLFVGCYLTDCGYCCILHSGIAFSKTFANETRDKGRAPPMCDACGALHRALVQGVSRHMWARNGPPPPQEVPK